MKQKFVLFSPWLLKSPVQRPLGSVDDFHSSEVLGSRLSCVLLRVVRPKVKVQGVGFGKPSAKTHNPR